MCLYLQGRKLHSGMLKEMALERSINLSLHCTMHRGTGVLQLDEVSKSLQQPSGRLVNPAEKRLNTVPQIINITQTKYQKAQDIDDKLII